MNRSEAEDLLDKNFRLLCDESEGLKELEIQKKEAGKKLLIDETELKQLEKMCSDLDNYYMGKKKEFFHKNIENFIYINYLTEEWKEKNIKNLDDVFFETTNETPKRGKFSDILRKIIEFENEIKAKCKKDFFIHNGLSAEIDGLRDNLLFKAMLLTGEELKTTKINMEV